MSRLAGINVTTINPIIKRLDDHKKRKPKRIKNNSTVHRVYTHLIDIFWSLTKLDIDPSSVMRSLLMSEQVLRFYRISNIVVKDICDSVGTTVHFANISICLESIGNGSVGFNVRQCLKDLKSTILTSNK